jgi:histidyl-tRNA synthetase
LDIINEEIRLKVIRTCDKFLRLGKAGILDLLRTGREDISGQFVEGCNLNEKQTKKILEFLESKNFSDLKKICKDNVFEEGIRELQDLIKIINLSSFSDRIIFTPSLMRGNEYYTSTIFEASLITKTKKGEKIELEYAVGGGGRYDRLVEKYTEDSYPGVGVSIGLSRLLFYFYQLKKKIKIKNKSPVVICVFDKNLMSDYKKMLDILRSENINSEIYYGDGNIKSQMKYADWRNSPACLLYGENEAKTKTVTIKNLIAGKKSSEEIKTREEWKKNESVQITVKIENLLDEIKKILNNN